MVALPPSYPSNLPLVTGVCAPPPLRLFGYFIWLEIKSRGNIGALSKCDNRQPMRESMHSHMSSRYKTAPEHSNKTTAVITKAKNIASTCGN